MIGTPQRIPYAVAARELLRNTLLDAAREELRSRRWADVTMADVALAAGVSRQTLYKEFGSREEFAQVLVMREADSFLLAVEDAVAAHLDDPTSALAA
ncbi:MAG TPA: helix-turn-helix domain-containing protein, partial [Solirubrobacteraceae bacterium]|nr:helix-turn-helix domain-containing protein [Solirubrobacteraceae bacterium]